MTKLKFEVAIQTGLNDRPKDHEISAALILANFYFMTDVVFLRPELNKTPDIEVNGLRWEIKSPTGKSNRTIENNLRTAREQSSNIVIDLRRIKMHKARAISHINYFLSRQTRIQHLIVITKNNDVVEIL